MTSPVQFVQDAKSTRGTHCDSGDCGLQLSLPMMGDEFGLLAAGSELHRSHQRLALQGEVAQMTRLA